MGAGHLRGPALKPEVRFEVKEGAIAMSGYAIEIFYSEEDQGYIAVVPDLEGCSAGG